MELGWTILICVAATVVWFIIPFICETIAENKMCNKENESDVEKLQRNLRNKK